MKKSKKFAFLAITGVVATATAVGGASYALFTGSTSNSGNTFTAGTLNIDSARDDVPLTGPMFYTQSPSNITGVGGMPTGVWAPGDQNTRALFLTNKGSLAGKLTNLSATAVQPGTDSNGNTVFTPASGAQLATDMAFANKATVMVWNVEKYDPTGDKWYLPDRDMTAQDINNAMQDLNQAFQLYLGLHPNPVQQTQAAEILDGDGASGYHLSFANAQFLQDINNLKQSVNQSDDFKVTSVATYPLSTFVNNGATPNINIQVGHNQTALLGYTVNFDKSAGNDMQGISAYFNFSSSWAQVRNNP